MASAGKRRSIRCYATTSSRANRANRLFSAKLTVHASSQHLDRRAVLRVRQVETANFTRVPGGAVVALEKGLTGRLEETVAGFEKPSRLPFQLKIEASGRHHPDGRDRMTMQSRRLAGRKFYAR